MPDAVHLIDDKRLITVAVHVEAAGAAVARRGARHRVEPRVILVGAEGAGNFDGGLPGALDSVDDERLRSPPAVGVPPAGGAVARRGARHRLGLRVARVEGGGAGDFPGSPPCAGQSGGPGSNSCAGSRHRVARPGDRCQAESTSYSKDHCDGTSSVKRHESLPCHVLLRKPAGLTWLSLTVVGRAQARCQMSGSPIVVSSSWPPRRLLNNPSSIKSRSADLLFSEVDHGEMGLIQYAPSQG